MRRTKEQAEKTRRLILASAETLFIDKGYENVSLDEIASAAGVTRGAIHWHFRNKQGLLFAIRDARGEPLRDLADRLAADQTLDPLLSLSQMMSCVFQSLQEDPRQRQIIRILLHVENADDVDAVDAKNAFQRRLHGSLVSIFEAAARSGTLPPFWTPCAAAKAFQALVSGLITEWAHGRTDFALVPDAEGIVHLVLASWDQLIKPAPARQRSRTAAAKRPAGTPARRKSATRNKQDAETH